MQSSERLQPLPQTTCWNSRLTAALWALEEGMEAGDLAELLTQRYGRSNACRIVDMASVRLWCAEGCPADDVFTMLVARRRSELSPSDCRAYVIEIWLAVGHAINAEEGSLTTHGKETSHAAA